VGDEAGDTVRIGGTGTSRDGWIMVGSVVGGTFSVGCIDRCVLLPIELG